MTDRANLEQSVGRIQRTHGFGSDGEKRKIMAKQGSLGAQTERISLPLEIEEFLETVH